MYGFWSDAFVPAPSAGAGAVTNGLETTTQTNAKNALAPASTGTVHGSTSATSRRFASTAAAEAPVRRRSQRRSEPACPLQNAPIVYASGSSRLECDATYASEKSCRRSAATSTAAATPVAANAATSAFRAEAVNGGRPCFAPTDPATSAYTAST